MSEIIIERINEWFQQCENMLPNIEEITEFEESVMELNRLTFGKGSTDNIIEYAKNFEETNTDHNILGLEQMETKLAVHEASIKNLKNQLSILDRKYEKKLEEKNILQNKMKEFSTDSDIILSFKLGTISHLSYNKKINFGFFMDKNTMDYKTFAYDINENSPENIEHRWTSLKSFISCGQNQALDK